MDRNFNTGRSLSFDGRMYRFSGFGRLFLRPRGPQLDAHEVQLGQSSCLGSSSLVTLNHSSSGKYLAGLFLI